MLDASSRHQHGGALSRCPASTMNERERNMSEKMYLVCDDCGEAFDSIDTASGHKCGSEDAAFYITPESEAF
jgi:hypothetical protein